MKRTPSVHADSQAVPVYSVDCTADGEARLQAKIAAGIEAKRLLRDGRQRAALDCLIDSPFINPVGKFLRLLAGILSDGELTKQSEIVTVNGETVWRNCDPLDPALWHGLN